MPDAQAEDNPYAAPVETGGAAAESEPLPGMDFPTLKKLRNHSHSIRALGGLWALATLLFLFVATSAMVRQAPDGQALIVGGLACAGLTGLACYGAWARPSWGRIVAIIMCVLGLFGGLLGLIVGILGLIALISAGGRLFGPRRIPHRDLEREYKRQKAEQRGRR
jgi:hypothetical protein